MDNHDIIASEAQTCLNTLRAGNQTATEAEACFNNTCKDIEENIRIMLQKKAETDSLLAVTRNKIGHYEEQEKVKQMEIYDLNAKLRDLESKLYYTDSEGNQRINGRVQNEIACVQSLLDVAMAELVKIQTILKDLRMAEADLVEKSETLEDQTNQAQREYDVFASEGQTAINTIKEQQHAASDLLRRQHNAIMDRPHIC